MSEKKTAEENVIETTETEAFEIIELAINDISVLTRAFTCISEAWGEEPLIESGPLEEDTQIVIH